MNKMKNLCKVWQIVVNILQNLVILPYTVRPGLWYKMFLGIIQSNIKIGLKYYGQRNSVTFNLQKLSS
jgi:hypothetical protein